VAAGLAVLACLPGLARAQASPSGRWMTLETAHFHVHVRADARVYGRHAAAVAESAYARLAAELPPPSSRIELVLADTWDFSEGLTTIFPWPAVVVFAVPPAADIELANYDSWLQFVLVHELTHVFHLDLARGWWRLGRRLFGRILFFPNAAVPDWVTEGLAVYYETRFTTAGRLRGSYFRAVLAAQAAEAGALPVDAAIGLGPRWPDGQRPYVFGSGFFASVAASAGDSAVPRFVRETARRPIPFLGLNGALKPAAGTSMLSAWRRWQDSLAAAAPVEAARTAPGRIIVRGLRDPATPRVSPDGGTVLFVHDDGRDAPTLAALQRVTGRVRALSRINGLASVAWGRDGAALVSQLDFTDPYTIRSDLWAVGAHGGERRLTRGARLQDPDVGPGGAVVATRVVLGGTQLVIRDSSSVTPLTSPEAGVEWAQPRWSPAGHTIAALRLRGGRRDLVLLDRSGAVVRQVTHDRATNASPAFSPDGRWLYWSSDRSGRAQVHATRADTRAARWWRVTDEPFGAYGPAPAADSVFYLAYHHDGFALAAAAFDTAGWTPIVPDTVEVTNAADQATATGTGGTVREEHAYRPWPSLVPRYWLPVLQAGSGAAWFGARTSGADVLRRHAYAAAVSLGTGAAAGTWRGAIGYVYARLVPWQVDASFTRDLALVDTLPGSGAPPACCHVDEDAALGATWVHLRWRTLVAARVGAEYQRSGTVRRAGPIASVSASHVVDPPFAVSLQNGWRASALARERWRTDGAGEYHEVLSRLRAYRALPVEGFARPVVAATIALGSLAGSERVVYGVGGVSGSGVTLAPGVGLGGGSPTFPVRGYPRDAILGRRAASASLELRLPLALVDRGPALLPVFLDRLSVSMFADGGVAWFPAGFTTSLPRRSSIGSVGVELNANLGVLYGVAIRARAGAAQPLAAGRSPSAYLALGPSF
jgi:hypothetical protein